MNVRRSAGRPVLPGVLAVLLLWGAILGAPDSAAALDTVTVAVVRDGAISVGDPVDLIEDEFRHLLGGEYQLEFDRDPRFDANWDAARVRPALEAALADGRIDIVLGVGYLVAQAAASPDLRLTRPFVGATLLSGGVPPVQFAEDGRVAKPNFVPVIASRRLVDELGRIREVFRVSRLDVGMPEVYRQSLAGVEEAIASLSSTTGLEIRTVGIGPGGAADLGTGAEPPRMFYLLATPELSLEERAGIYDTLQQSRVPTLSGVGPADLDIGALATFRVDTRQEVIRRVALNLHHVALGGSTADLSPLLVSETKLVIDGKTAAATGFRPNYETRMLAELRDPGALDTDARPLDPELLIALADTNSTALALSRQTVVTSESTRKSALGPLLPQLGIDGSLSYYDLPSTNVLLPERVGNFGLRVSQMIYDDAAVSAYRQTGRFLEATRLLEEARQLDVFFAAEQTYYQLLNAAVYRDIQIDNLRLTEGNLDIARTRADVGQAGQDEVYRWEAEVAKLRTTVLESDAQVERVRLALNQVLGLDLKTRWIPREVEPAELKFSEVVQLVDPELSAPADYDRFESAVVQIALQAAPELQAVDEYLGAQDIGIGQRKRSFFLPRFYVDATLGQNFYQDPDDPDITGTAIEGRVLASLPIFEGARRINELNREQSIRRELEHERMLTAEQIERQARATVRRLRSAVPGLRFSQSAADFSQRNFEVVRAKYANGIVGITDLLEAQNAQLRDDLGVLASRFSLLQEVAVLERSLAFFAAASTPEGIENFAARLRAAMETASPGSN